MRVGSPRRRSPVRTMERESVHEPARSTRPRGWDHFPAGRVDPRQKGGEMMSLRTLALIGAVAAFPAVATAQDADSASDQVACTPDVYRLCSSLIPDQDAIVGCLEQNKRRLSPACRQVFSRPAPKPDTDED